MKITVLAENTSCCGLSSEHGLSLFAESEDCTFLFDTGQSSLFSENAEKLGADLTAVDLCILSHGHYDHGGGIGRFLQINDHAPVYVNPFSFGPYYEGPEKYVGLDPSLKDSGRIVFTEDRMKLTEHLTLFSCSRRKKLVDMGSFGLSVKERNRLVPDRFRHEQYLLAEENGKRILFSGCSHRGILNIMNWMKPDVMIGGFHLIHMPLDETLADYARVLDAYDTVYYTCHCTGVPQYEFMKQYMKKLNYISTGERIEI